MIVHILSCTHKYDRSIDCMAVAGDLLFKEGLPSDVWEECLSASLYCAPTNASIDKNCMESVSVFYNLLHVCVYTYSYYVQYVLNHWYCVCTCSVYLYTQLIRMSVYLIIACA